MIFNTFSWKIVDHVGHLVLDRPPANTMTREFFDELGRFTRHILPEATIGALVIYGRGRHFSAGAVPEDLTARVREQLPDDYPVKLPAFLHEASDSFSRLERLPIPTFAAIRGTCLGSAMELALACQFRICAEGTVMGFPESTFGLMPGCGGTVRLTGITGRARAIELLLGGRHFSAEEALQWGIVHRIVNRKTTVEETVSMARRIIDNRSL